MDTANTATIVRLLLAWGAPLILLIVVTVRFFQRSRSRGSRRATGVGRPGAGAMRRRDRAIVDPARIDTIFRSAIVCRIALAADGVPYIVPLSYGVADSVADCMELEEARLRFVATGRGPYRIYFHAANEGRKLEMARSNPRVCIEVE